MTNISLNLNSAYKEFLKSIKDRYRVAQIKASYKVNVEVLLFNWELGKSIIEKQKEYSWGSKFLEQLSHDLTNEFNGAKGFSIRNLQFMQQFAQLYKDGIVKQAVSQLPWGHIIVLMQKVKNVDAFEWYVHNTVQNNISRSILIMQIEQGLYEQQGIKESKLSNFEISLPKPQSDLAMQMLKNPYNFEFLTVGNQAQEKEIEDALINHISKFLTELGVGFAYMGKQYKLYVQEDLYVLDMLFFHVKLNCYVVVELKATPFKPEYAGKLNFYLSVVDEVLKETHHHPTIGILLCKSHKKYQVEYALRNVSSPMGISEYTLMKELPQKLKTELPTIEDIESELEYVYKQ